MTDTIPSILISKNYDDFSFVDYNRNIVRNTVDRLKNEFVKENNFMYFPIIVDQNKKIIDGQHRFVACKELNQPIYYILKKAKITPFEIRTVNKAAKKHTLKDVFEMECKSGNKKAIAINEYYKRYNGTIAIGAIIAICIGVYNSGKLKDILEENKYELRSDSQIDIICKTLMSLTGGTLVSITVYNVLLGISNKNKIPFVKLMTEALDNGLVLNSKMSKNSMENKVVSAYNFRKHKNNRISI
jgi:hypothetical protein